MPKLVSEISQGMSYEFSSEESSIAASAVRVFRIIKLSPDEFIDIPVVCQSPIGTEHPRNPGLWCHTFSAVYEGESRMVLLATFNYRTTPSADSSGGGQDPKSYSPEIRPANWYTTTSLVEVPAMTWERVNAADGSSIQATTPTENPAGDLYEGVMRYEPIVTIHVEQFAPSDPTTYNLFAGYTNQEIMRVGSMSIPRRCLMFRGVQSKPTVESFNGVQYRGWMCGYEFLFKRNVARAYVGGAYVAQDVGWDVLQPVSGFNVKAFAPPGGGDQDPYGQPLKLDDDGKVAQPLALPDGVVVGRKMRGTIGINTAGGFWTQRTSASPIALNDDGTPRSESATPKVLVYRYKVTNEINFTQQFGLRLSAN